MRMINYSISILYYIHTHIIHVRIDVPTGYVITVMLSGKKFGFDIWGSTVNLASRLESLTVSMSILVDEQTMKETSSKFKYNTLAKVLV
jgi:adenylate cyclase